MFLKKLLKICLISSIYLFTLSTFTFAYEIEQNNHILDSIEKQKIQEKVQTTIELGTKVASESKTLYNSMGDPVFNVEVYENQRELDIPSDNINILNNSIDETIIEKTRAMIIVPAAYREDYDHDRETISVKAYSTIQYAQGTTIRGTVGYRLISGSGGWVNEDNQIISTNHSALLANKDALGGDMGNAPVSNLTWSMTSPSSYVVSSVILDKGRCGVQSSCTIYEAMYPEDKWTFHFKNAIIDNWWDIW